MNIKQTSWCITFVGVDCIPSVVVDEVSDKEPSIQLVLILGFLVEGELLLVSWYRWWLGFLLSPIPILLIAESVSLWNETVMREALISEQGWIYFGALGVQGILMLIGIITGGVLGYSKRKAV